MVFGNILLSHLFSYNLSPLNENCKQPKKMCHLTYSGVSWHTLAQLYSATFSLFLNYRYPDFKC